MKAAELIKKEQDALQGAILNAITSFREKTEMIPVIQINMTRHFSIQMGEIITWQVSVTYEQITKNYVYE